MGVYLAGLAEMMDRSCAEFRPSLERETLTYRIMRAPRIAEGMASGACTDLWVCDGLTIPLPEWRHGQVSLDDASLLLSPHGERLMTLLARSYEQSI